MKIEYSIRPVTRYAVHRYEQDERGAASSTRGEYDNMGTAYEVGYALCKAEHDKLGYPADDPRVQYPQLVDGVRMNTDANIIPGPVRQRVATELDRIHHAHGQWLRFHDCKAHPGLEAAQQALCWVMDTGCSASPYDMIARQSGWVSFGESICGLKEAKPPSEEPPL